MLFSTKKFKPEIDALRAAEAGEVGLHPLRLAQLKGELLKQLELPAEPAVGLGRLLARARQPRTHFMRYVLTSVLGVSVLGSAVLASGNALPGSPLYPVKRLKEKVELGLTVSPVAHAEVHADQARERLQELVQVQAVAEDSTPLPTVVTDTPAVDTATVAPVPPVVTPPAEAPASRHNRREAEARAEATVEVEAALTNLAQVRAELKARGNLGAAGEIGRNIKRLRAEAKAHRVEVKFQDSEDNTTDSSSDQPDSAPTPTRGSGKVDRGNQDQRQRGD